VTITTESSESGAAKLYHMNLSGCVGHVIMSLNVHYCVLCSSTVRVRVIIRQQLTGFIQINP